MTRTYFRLSTCFMSETAFGISYALPLIGWLINISVRALTVPMHLGLTNGPFVLHDLISVPGGPVPRKTSRWPQDLIFNVLWVQENEPTYTGCPRRNVRDFVRVFHMLNNTDITQNTYIQSWTVTEIMVIEKCGLLGCPRTVRRPWRHTFPLRMPGNESSLAKTAVSAR